MRIALGQLESGTDTAANLRAMEDFTRRAAAAGAALIAFPEYASYEKKKIDATFPSVAQPLDGKVGTQLAAMAARHGITVVAGVVEASPAPDRAYNTLAAFGPSGQLLAAYRKIHLFDAQGFEESAFIAPAPSTDPVTFDLDGLRFGLLACYDLRFPEQSQALSDAGAHVLLACSSWVPGEFKLNQWRTLLSARAIENGLFVAGSCQAPPVSVGHSLIAGPMGAIVAELGTQADLLVTDLDPAAIAETRQHFPVHRQRRIS